MSTIVVDASVALSWLLDDEHNDLADSVLDRLKQDNALVPQLWHLEVRNALLVAQRRKRISASQLVARLDELGRLPIQTDTNIELTQALSLAQKHGLSFYDAVYLELAIRREARLVSLDAALCRAGASEGVQPVNTKS